MRTILEAASDTNDSENVVYIKSNPAGKTKYQ